MRPRGWEAGKAAGSPKRAYLNYIPVPFMIAGAVLLALSTLYPWYSLVNYHDFEWRDWSVEQPPQYHMTINDTLYLHGTKDDVWGDIHQVGNTERLYKTTFLIDIFAIFSIAVSIAFTFFSVKKGLPKVAPIGGLVAALAAMLVVTNFAGQHPAAIAADRGWEGFGQPGPANIFEGKSDAEEIPSVYDTRVAEWGPQIGFKLASAGALFTVGAFLVSLAILIIGHRSGRVAPDGGAGSRKNVRAPDRNRSHQGFRIGGAQGRGMATVAIAGLAAVLFLGGVFLIAYSDDFLKRESPMIPDGVPLGMRVEYQHDMWIIAFISGNGRHAFSPTLRIEDPLNHTVTVNIPLWDRNDHFQFLSGNDDVLNAGDTLVVYAEPGIAMSGFKVSVTSDGLTIAGPVTLR